MYISKKGWKTVKITALLENTAARADMQTEHGLSLYVETATKKILFDMGQTSFFAENAEMLGIDLADVDLAVLSHGHYDHGGGLAVFLEKNDHAPVFIHKDAFLPHYNGTQKYIGLDTALASHPRIVWTEEAYRIDENLRLFSHVPKKIHLDFGSGGLTEKVGDAFIPDDFRHEQYLFIEENGKRVLLSGCSHKGILDIAVQTAPDALIGGFHFSKLSLDEKLIEAAHILNGLPTDFYTCHCTGATPFDFMKQYMDRLQYLSCGMTITI